MAAQNKPDELTLALVHELNLLDLDSEPEYDPADDTYLCARPGRYGCGSCDGCIDWGYGEGHDDLGETW